MQCALAGGTTCHTILPVTPPRRAALRPPARPDHGPTDRPHRSASWWAVVAFHSLHNGATRWRGGWLGSSDCTAPWFALAWLEGVYTIGLCVSRFLSEKSTPREQGKLGSKRAVKLFKGTWHQIKNWERKSPSQGIIQKCAPHMRTPCTKKDAPAKQHGIQRKNIYKLKNSDKTTLFSPTKAKVMLAPTSQRPVEREFVVDSGASVHMMSKKESSSEEMDIVKRSRTPTVVLTASGEVHTDEEAQVLVHDPNLFVIVQLLEETSAVLSLGKLCRDRGYSYECDNGQKPRLTKGGKSIVCKTNNLVPIVVPGLSANSESVSSSTSPSQDSLIREAEIAAGNSMPPASGSVLERSDEIACRKLMRSPKQNCLHPHTVLRNQIWNTQR